MALNQTTSFRFQLPNGDFVPPHFHITEVGMVHKHFIDCGGVVREESKVSFQIWTSDDFDHRLSTLKLLGIIKKGERLFNSNIENLDVEFEHQDETVGIYTLTENENVFILQTTKTDCLAKDECGIEIIEKENECCTTSGCC